MNRRFILVLALSGLLCTQAAAAVVDTVVVFSAAMNKSVKNVVIMPDSYSAQSTGYPCIYLLHGATDDYAGWVQKVPEIEALADQYGLLIVCPDGGYTSWYFDSPIDPAMQYETYVSQELVAFMDKEYRTLATPAGRAITGLSMGGHGALFLCFRHQDVFGAAGSMSGGVDLRPFPNNWNIRDRIGTQREHPDRWEENSVINLLYLLDNPDLPVLIDCGTKDFFYQVNRNLHEKMLERNIPHDYIERPGVHNWDYWSNSVKYQFLFFHLFFTRKK